MENSKDETIGVVLRCFIVGAILILILAVSSRCYKAIRRARKASKKTSSRPASRTTTQESILVVSNEPESRPPLYENLIQEDGRGPMLETRYEEMVAKNKLSPMMSMDSSPIMESCPTNIGGGGPKNHAYAVVEFVFGGPNDSDSD
ncbi:Uncharacterized protein Rs2_52729 [Raphanus sativus]|uniref:Uncharacterized protein LOC130507765 n=1 Tax=Raphanus sativus TaxID=3726 RepID=A0A9W3D3Y1_RAPSA|nr:uncharacterized protein LOC130507765 [Raphanus sativus]KAJ4865755.1 Uncharacterized protein Rs2_52729 [Raphanus sativus]